MSLNWKKQKRYAAWIASMMFLAGCSTTGTVVEFESVSPPGYPPVTSAGPSQAKSAQSILSKTLVANNSLTKATERKISAKVLKLDSSEVKVLLEELSVEDGWKPTRGEIKLVVLQEAEEFQQPVALFDSDVDSESNNTELIGTSIESILPETAQQEDHYPIDLSTAIHLAGANNLQVALAVERVNEAAARLEKAEVLWVPSLSFGAGYTRHDGQLQSTEGDILNLSRQSTFWGGGPGVGGLPLTGSGGNPRLFIGLNPAEAYFQPLSARRSVAAAQWNRTVTFNDTLLEVGTAYYDLVRAQLRVGIAEENVRNTLDLADLTKNFVEAGAGLAADAARARAQVADARRKLVDAKMEVELVSAELSRLLRLDPSITLAAVDPLPIPVSLISAESSLPELIAQGLAARPELSQQQYEASVAQAQYKLELWRPWVPNISAGNSAGGFGGGRNDTLGEFKLRNDFEVMAVWEIQNMGLGNHALQCERASQERQEWMKYHALRDQVSTDVTKAYHRVELSRQQVAATKEQVLAAAEALPLNFNGIRGGELRPIEAQQAIAQLAESRGQFLDAVITFDQAQLELLRAVGTPPHAPAPVAAPTLGGSFESSRIPPVPPAASTVTEVGKIGKIPQLLPILE